MKIVPPELRPPEVAVSRRHQPKPSTGREGFRSFLSCLRWDFGFTCAFCLLHEADFSPKLGAAGTRQMSIEHHVPRSVDPSKSNEYSNCIYSCMRCNLARLDRPVIDGSGRRLLDPSRNVWGDHFLWHDCELSPREGDSDASYTHEAYDLDAPDKVERRRFRKDFYGDRIPLFVRAADRIERLLSKAERYRDLDRELFYVLMETVEELRRFLRTARRELAWFGAIPPDAPSTCRCEDTEHHSLPASLEKQLIDLP